MDRFYSKLIVFNTTLLSFETSSLISQVWFYSSQALAKPSDLPDLLLGHANGRGHKDAVVHLGIISHLDG
jgi:hypothetical protein